MTEKVKPRRQYDSRRRREQAAQTRQDILAAAGTLFREHGYAGTSMTQIAAEAGRRRDDLPRFRQQARAVPRRDGGRARRRDGARRRSGRGASRHPGDDRGARSAIAKLRCTLATQPGHPSPIRPAPPGPPGRHGERPGARGGCGMRWRPGGSKARDGSSGCSPARAPSEPACRSPRRGTRSGRSAPSQSMTCRLNHTPPGPSLLNASPHTPMAAFALSHRHPRRSPRRTRGRSPPRIRRGTAIAYDTVTLPPHATAAIVDPRKKTSHRPSRSGPRTTHQSIRDSPAARHRVPTRRSTTARAPDHERRHPSTPPPQRSQPAAPAPRGAVVQEDTRPRPVDRQPMVAEVEVGGQPPGAGGRARNERRDGPRRSRRRSSRRKRARRSRRRGRALVTPRADRLLPEIDGPSGATSASNVK